MGNKILYKYRSLENFKRFEEILLNQEMYAGIYTEMNDLMEGYYNASLDIPTSITNIILKNKQELRFCCFSKYHKTGLQWSHYADSGKGVVLGVEVSEAYENVDIVYQENHPSIKDFDYPYEASKEILRYKLQAWEYEKEVRVFAPFGEKFIKLTVKQVIIGPRTSPAHIDQIQEVVDSVNIELIEPIKVSKIRVEDLDYT
jgi:hypothetical protein